MHAHIIRHLVAHLLHLRPEHLVPLVAQPQHAPQLLPLALGPIPPPLLVHHHRHRRGDGGRGHDEQPARRRRVDQARNLLLVLRGHPREPLLAQPPLRLGPLLRRLQQLRGALAGVLQLLRPVAVGLGLCG